MLPEFEKLCAYADADPWGITGVKKLPSKPTEPKEWKLSSEIGVDLLNKCLKTEYRFDRKSFLFLLMCLQNCEDEFSTVYIKYKLQEKIKRCPNSDTYILRYTQIHQIYNIIIHAEKFDRKTKNKAKNYLLRVQNQILKTVDKLT